MIHIYILHMQRQEGIDFIYLLIFFLLLPPPHPPPQLPPPTLKLEDLHICIERMFFR